MMYASPIRPDLTVEQLLARFPVAAVVFVRCGMSCVGCDMASLEILADVAVVYGQEPGGFLAALRAAVAPGGRA